VAEIVSIPLKSKLVGAVSNRPAFRENETLKSKPLLVLRVAPERSGVHGHPAGVVQQPLHIQPLDVRCVPFRFKRRRLLLQLL
jgi:hypothetical protein